MIFQNLLKRISQALDNHNIPYMVIGGQAVLLYGEPRLTKDIDIALGVNIDRLNEILAIAKILRLEVLVQNVEEFTKETMVLPTADEDTKIRIDLIFSFSPYEKVALERAKGVRFGKNIVKFASLEDVVIHKVIAGRARDLEDIRNILLKNPRYDSQYIEKWLLQFDNSLNEHFLNAFQKLTKELFQ